MHSITIFFTMNIEALASSLMIAYRYCILLVGSKDYCNQKEDELLDEEKENLGIGRENLTTQKNTESNKRN